MRTLVVLLMVASGMGLGAQIVMNSRVREAMQSPVMGAAVSLAGASGGGRWRTPMATTRAT